ncbi:MAG TPA: sugar transporter, partial [Bacteroidales bacterium]|nr:sugar transporter [Bacteroidales bacterium]
VLGQVTRPGQYTIPEGQTTLLNAIGLAGDLTIYGKRDDILMVRNENGTITKERINLMDANFINSPYFQLKQGDVIYVSANQTKEKISRQDPNTNLYLAIAGTVIGLAGIFITIFKK